MPELAAEAAGEGLAGDAPPAPVVGGARAYTALLVRTCHKRGAHAVGGMAAQVPGMQAAAAGAAFAAVRLGEEREAGGGFDGTWGTHPGLVPLQASVSGRHRSSTGCRSPEDKRRER
ncbi:hypothetical protein GCM10010329_62480 [Streptomyces spiroverticillatus]|nr:hypothetical protein GCM10010329_62480 [Streptomyces spiroverticillatus]